MNVCVLTTLGALGARTKLKLDCDALQWILVAHRIKGSGRERGREGGSALKGERGKSSGDRLHPDQNRI